MHGGGVSGSSEKSRSFAKISLLHQVAKITAKLRKVLLTAKLCLLGASSKIHGKKNDLQRQGRFPDTCQSPFTVVSDRL
jgi:hypothetical protein